MVSRADVGRWSRRSELGGPAMASAARPFLRAMRAIWPNLRRACKEPDNRDAREAMMVGSLQAGIALLQQRFESEFLEMVKKSNEARKVELAAQEHQSQNERLKPLALA